ncbi:restriction endonuclease subunit S [Sphaerotilus sp.]|uniref:restriction endonuclease subunit S n=1 Tax=Sphaerotilus sp. TaxID=2093942 RepID=UPI0025F45545|nr:restriction endonuclease subunit S [Sphaerotilus sp.]
MSELAFTTLAALADITMGQSPDSALCNTNEQGLPFLQGCAEFGQKNPRAMVFCESAVRTAKAGSVLISVRAPVGTMNYADQDYCVGRGLAAFKANPSLSNSVFLKHAVELNSGYLHRRSQGSTFAAVSSEDIRKIPVPKFSLAQQNKIAGMLDGIDTAIERTEALIEKYQQIKAGLMHDLFTRGVLPDGKLRPTREQAPELYRETGIGWVPKEWGISKLETMAKIASGVTLGAKESPSDTIEAPYLRVANVQDGYLDLAEIKTVRISRNTLNDLRLQPGDVLMNEGGDFDKLGRGAVWAGEIENCVHQNHVFRVRVDEEFMLPNYLALYSESSFGKKYFLISSKQSTNLASINSTQLKNYPIALPDVAEQRRICATLARANQRIQALKTEAEKMRSQKNGLMHDLLTGEVAVKVDAPIEQEA